MDQNPPGAGQTSGSEQTPEPSSTRPRRFGATRVRPRIEVGRPKPEEVPTGTPLTPEVLEPGMERDPQGVGMGTPFGGGADPFGPRTFAGGRVRVYGCSPGCLIASLLVSLLLTLLLNALV